MQRTKAHALDVPIQVHIVNVFHQFQTSFLALTQLPLLKGLVYALNFDCRKNYFVGYSIQF